MLDRYDQDLLLDYLEGELDADRRAQVEAMLEEDPQLAGLLNEMARDREALRSLPQAEAPGDLVHDVTQTLERRMLLDDSVDDTAPIPIARAMAGEPARGVSWGRIIGLSGLAASVALAAGILVITFDDTLQRTANEFADNTSAAETEETAVAKSDLEDEGAVLESAGELEGVARPEGVAVVPPADTRLIPDAPQPGPDTNESIARGGGPTPGLPDANPLIPTEPGAGVADRVALNPPLITGSTAAISVIQPSQQLVLFSESPEVTLEQLVEFCVGNGIPVVQPDELRLARARAADNGAAEELGGLFGGDDVDEPVAEYALLINESQLDTLVQSLNTDLNVVPNDAGQSELFSNQAALLEDLPQAQYAERRELADKAQGEDAPADTQYDQAVLSEQQQAIKLKSPDLGSDYNNTRNAYNLNAQQRQAGYGQQLVPLAGIEPTPETPEQAKPRPEAEGVDRDPVPDSVVEASPAIESRDDADAAPAAPQGDEERALAEQDLVAKESVRGIDPSRGNWLSAHLPVADTTPLLLSWREDQVDQPTKLVPVMIQRAEPEKVNTLRLRQQLEYANRAGNRAIDAEAAAEEAEAETEPDAAEAEPPVEAEPAEPAE